MDKGFGISAIVVVIISFFIPVIGHIGVAIAMVLASIGALAGDRTFAIITTIVGAVSIFIFSPLMWVAIYGLGSVGVAFVIVILALPIIAIRLNASGKIELGKNPTSNTGK
ncbi:MAG: hypothetical protein HRU29_11955 [Rhizobiales bacterium]|nr:hypothetical protein [Hyphomicrobiales bacterium]NRB15103.1 hypothetical protein [Hyphomicrobiales bacterium]